MFAMSRKSVILNTDIQAFAEYTVAPRGRVD